MRAYGRVSEGFDVSCGVRQGCVLAPTLFNLYFDMVIRMSLDSHHMQNKGVGVAYLHDAKLVGNRRKLQFETLITDLEYADDMALLADSWNDLEAMPSSLSTHCRNFGLSISCSKTKTMAVLPSSLYPQPAPIHLSPNQPPLSLSPASSTWEALYRMTVALIWRSTPGYARPLRHLVASVASSGTRRRSGLKPSFVSSLLLLSPPCYMVQNVLCCWSHKSTGSSCFIMRCLRIILGISVRNMKRHTTICKLAHQHRLSSLLSSRRLRFLGHIARMPDSRLPKQLLVCALTGGARSAGGQKCRWNDLIQRDLVRSGIEQDWRELAQDRSAWRGIVEMSINTINEEFEKKEDNK